MKFEVEISWRTIEQCKMEPPTVERLKLSRAFGIAVVGDFPAKNAEEREAAAEAKMESWVPLFDIFLNSPTPETDAAQWLDESFDASSATRITAVAFLSLLTQPQIAIIVDSSSSSPPSTSSRTKRLMFMQTLPCMVQSRILSFLALERQRFTALELLKLARTILSSGEGVDFWVERSARHLFDVLSDRKASYVSSMSTKEKASDHFESVPDWLMNEARRKPPLFPWLPISLDEFHSVVYSDSIDEDYGDDGLLSQGRHSRVQDTESDSKTEVHPVYVEQQIREVAIRLKQQLLNFESTTKTVTLADDILELCSRRESDSFAAMELIEPCRADDETTSILLAHLTSAAEDELSWPSRVLCSLVLPKLLVLDVPISRVLLSAVLEYCKHHQRAAEYGLLFPLILRKEGINSPIADVITRIFRECLHSAHVTAFCQKLLCGGKDEKSFIIFLPSHQSLISHGLVWTESFFGLLQNIMNHNVHLTQDSVDQIVSRVLSSSQKFPNSLKFGNFLLCFVTKCSSSLMSHKLTLIKAVECTNTFVTKSILSKLSTL